MDFISLSNLSFYVDEWLSFDSRRRLYSYAHWPNAFDNHMGRLANESGVLVRLG